jgi:hypothetical protein
MCQTTQIVYFMFIVFKIGSETSIFIGLIILAHCIIYMYFVYLSRAQVLNGNICQGFVRGTLIVTYQQISCGLY